MEIGDVLYVALYSASNLTFVARAQNNVIWAESSTNHLLSIG